MEFLVPLLILSFFTVLGGLVLWKIFDIVRTSIHKDKGMYDQESFERMAQAFINHKKETEQRLRNIETALSGEKRAVSSKKFDDSNYSNIEIDGEQSELKHGQKQNETINKQRRKT